jgi:hypothetical protein
MYRSLLRIKGLGFVLWQARHMAYHVMLGLMWVWVLREWWGVFNPVWVVVGAVGSVLPDIDHIHYFLTYGRKDSYTKEIFSLLKHRHWRRLFQFIATGHKHNTSLTFHNVYVAAIFFVGTGLATVLNWQAGVVLFGAIVSHYLLDMADDIVQLGEMNPNWIRWGRPKK